MTPAIADITTAQIPLIPEFETAKVQLIQLLNQDYMQGKIDLPNMMAVLFIFGKARNKKELVKFAQIFVQDFPVLAEFLITEKASTKDKIEDQVEIVVRKMMQDNPAQAAQVAQKAMEEGMTLEKLETLYPDIAKYKN